MELRRTKHAVYELKYHLVWVPKYRARILDKEIARYIKEIFERIAEEYDMHIDTMEVMKDHVHVLIEAPPSYSPSKIVQMLKSITAREIYKKFPKMREAMWSGKIWNEGYFVRSVGDAVTKEVIRKYIRYQNREREIQPKMFEES